MDVEPSAGRTPTSLAWRGVGVPDDPDRWPDADADENEVAEAANARSRRNRRLAVLGAGGLLLATTVVTGTGGGTDGEPAPEPPATTLVDVDDAFPPAGVDDEGAGALDRDRSVPTPAIDPVEGGLRYGGAGGGADIRSDEGRVGPASDDPFPLDWTPSRLPSAVDPVWSQTIALGDRRGGEPSIVLDDVDLGFGDDIVVVVTPTGVGEVVVTALAPDGGDERWSTTVSADDARLIGAAEGIVGVEIREEADTSVLLFDEVDGAPVAQTFEPVARAQEVLFERLRGSREVDVDTLAGREFVTEVGAPQMVREMAAALMNGSATALSVDEVAVGRLLLLVGGRLVGVRTTATVDPDSVVGADDVTESPLIVDWVRRGVPLLSSPSERGATLLVSDGRGSQSVVDAATGRVVTELGRLPSSVSVYTPAWNGVVVKRPALIGSSLEAVDLDGRVRWTLLGAPPFAVGDGLVVTASVGPDGLTITGRS